MEHVLTKTVARETDRELERLLAAEWAGLVRLARSVVGDVDAEDLVQEGLVAAWRKRRTLREPKALHAWLTRIVLRRCYHHLRRHQFSEPLSSAPEPRVRDATDIDVHRVLAQLTSRQRAVMHLTIIEERSDSEIAALLNMRPATVRGSEQVRRAAAKADR